MIRNKRILKKIKVKISNVCRTVGYGKIEKKSFNKGYIIKKIQKPKVKKIKINNKLLLKWKFNDFL